MKRLIEPRLARQDRARRHGRSFVRRCPDLVTVVFVENEDRLTVDAALAGGAYWAVDRRPGATEVVRAVTEAYKAKRDETEATRMISGTRASLTRRELEILRLVAEGRPNREMATLLWVTEQTIKFHLANTYRKLNVTGRSEAIRCAHEHGFGDTSSGEPGTGIREPRRPIKPSLTGGAAVDPTEDAELPDETDTPRGAHSQAA